MCWVCFSSYVTSLTSQFCHLLTAFSVKMPYEHSARILSRESCSWLCCLAARLCLKQCHGWPSFVSLGICVDTCCLECLVLSQFQMLCSGPRGLWPSALALLLDHWGLSSFSASWAVCCCLPCTVFVDDVKSSRGTYWRRLPHTWVFTLGLRLRILCDSLMKTLMIPAYIPVLIFQFSLFLSSTL